MSASVNVALTPPGLLGGPIRAQIIVEPWGPTDEPLGAGAVLLTVATVDTVRGPLAVCQLSPYDAAALAALLLAYSRKVSSP